MVKKIAYLVGAVILVFMLGNVIVKSAGRNSTEIKEGYTEITDVEGISFYVDDRLLDMATAITQISDEAGLDSSTYYVYKDGSTRYILFNLNKLVVMVQKGTSFHFEEAENYEKALESSNICNIWFSKEGKSLDITEGKDKYVATVNAAITITRTLYDDFTGKLVTISSNGEEWGIFVGVPGTNYSAVSSIDKEIIETMAESIHTVETSDTETPTNIEQQPEERTTTETETIESASMETTISEEYTEVYETSSTPESIITEPTTESENSLSEEPETNTEEVQSEQETNVDTISVIISGETGIIEQEQEEISEQETIEPPENDNEQEVQNPKETITEMNLIEAPSQQKEKVSSDGFVYVSDIYSMLDIGDSAIITGIDYKSKNYEEPVIRLTEIYSGYEATQLLKEVLGSNYAEPKAGCSWNVVRYDVDYSNCIGKPYVNIKLRGMDGTVLKYRGVKYSKKTHDIFTEVYIEGNWNVGYLCYYEVPNGCKEYVLECGEGTIEKSKEIKAAYYAIKNEE